MLRSYHCVGLFHSASEIHRFVHDEKAPLYSPCASWAFLRLFHENDPPSGEAALLIETAITPSAARTSLQTARHLHVAILQKR